MVWPPQNTGVFDPQKCVCCQPAAAAECPIPLDGNISTLVAAEAEVESDRVSNCIGYITIGVDPTTVITTFTAVDTTANTLVLTADASLEYAGPPGGGAHMTFYLWSSLILAASTTISFAVVISFANTGDNGGVIAFMDCATNEVLDSVSFSASGTYTLAAPGTGPYILLITVQNNCESGNAAVAATITITGGGLKVIDPATFDYYDTGLAAFVEVTCPP